MGYDARTPVRQVMSTFPRYARVTRLTYMTETDIFTLEQTIEIDATPAEVWALVSDLPRLAEWSPQVVKTFVRGGDLKLGSNMININRSGWKRWPTQSKVVEYDRDTKVAFRVKENYTIWSFSLADNGQGGTQVTHRRDCPKGISKLSLAMTKIVFGGIEPFRKELLKGMGQTLERLKSETEKSAA